MMEYAHSVSGSGTDSWEPLTTHLNAVAKRAADHACAFDAEKWAWLAGILHDLGKVRPEYQAYLRGEHISTPHSGEGARLAVERYGGMGKLIAYCIAGHHTGLANGMIRSEGRPTTPLQDRLQKAEKLVPPDDLPEDFPPLPEARANNLPAPLADLPNDETANFPLHFFIRMLFSALVDADFLETEAFYDRAKGHRRERGWMGSLKALAGRLDAHLAKMGNNETKINRLRAKILAHVRNGAGEAPGLFSLTVPTGGGKTLISLAFALDHAIRHGLERVIYVIPYVSIIEQTAGIFREVLGDDAVLEHHASFDWRGLDDQTESERLRLAAQNWDRPVVVTTAIQFFESLFSNRSSKCRKLHRLAKSVIILDEAQMLPLHLLRPCLAALKELVRGYGSSVVFCTATQPALLKGPRGDGFSASEGLEPEHVRELAPDPPALYKAFRRVHVHDAGTLNDDELAVRLREHEQVLVIVNNRRHARALFNRLQDEEGTAVLTTWMTPTHRRTVLKEVRGWLSEGRPVRLVATSLVEAGVDIDFPCVWREAAGIDSIAQAAGRCNREGKRGKGDVFVFRSDAEFSPPAELRQFAEIGRQVLDCHEDPLSLEAVRDYFREVYWRRGVDALDAAMVGSYRGIMAALERVGNQYDFPFADIAAAFRLIRDETLPLIIRGGDWGVPEKEMKRLQGIPHTGSLARAFQPYQVSVAPRLRNDLIRLGAASWWREGEFGQQFAVLDNAALYDDRAGFGPDDPEDLGRMIY